MVAASLYPSAASWTGLPEHRMPFYTLFPTAFFLPSLLKFNGLLLFTIKELILFAVCKCNTRSLENLWKVEIKRYWLSIILSLIDNNIHSDSFNNNFYIRVVWTVLDTKNAEGMEKPRKVLGLIDFSLIQTLVQQGNNKKYYFLGTT